MPCMIHLSTKATLLNLKDSIRLLYVNENANAFSHLSFYVNAQTELPP